MGADLQQQHRHDEAPAGEVLREQPAAETGAGLAPGVVGVARAGGELLRVLDGDATSDLPPAEPPGGLVIGRADDPAEAAADRAAAQVVQHLRRSRSATPAVAPSCDVGGDAGHGHVHRRADGAGADPLGGTAASAEVSDVVARGGGSALPGPFREQVQDAFGEVDLGHVRVHTDDAAASATQAAGAQAFTVGSHVYFGKGTYDTGSERGQELIAHELAHVVQEGAAPAVQRKMWEPKRFSQMTAEGGATFQGTAQKVIVGLLKDYIATYEAHGIVSPADAPKALTRIAEMRDSAQMWIDDHTTADAVTGAAKTDPHRVKRMAGFVAFRDFLDRESATLEAYADKPAGEAVEAIAPSAGYLKLAKKYDGSAKGFFERMGDLAEQAVEEDGDSSDLEAEVKFPIDPSGIGFIGGKFTAGIEKDDGQTTLNGTLSITGGADVDVAEVSAELGGYVKSQAPTGGKAMELLSYAMYRRFRESSLSLRGVANYIWGGQASSYGYDKAEAWSRKLERDTWGEGAEGADKSYVETGGRGAVGASAAVPGAEAEVSAEGRTGRRIDQQSMQERKGGAGNANRTSDGALAKFTSSATGGTRGAQKRVSRDVHSFTVAGAVGGGLPGASLKGEATLALQWMNDGVSSNPALNPQGKASATTLTEATLELAATAALPSGEAAGPQIEKWLGLLQGELESFVQKKAKPAAARKAEEDPESDEAELTGRLEDFTVTALDADELQEQLVEKCAAGVGIAGPESSEAYRLGVTFDLVEKAITFELKKTSEDGIALPKALAVKVSKATRLMKVVYKGGAWSKA